MKIKTKLKRIGLLILLLVWTTMAFNAVGVKSSVQQSSPQKQFWELSNEEIERQYGLDLSWKEKVGLWIMRKKIKKQLKKAKQLEQLKASCQEPSDCYKILLKDGYVVYARDLRFEEKEIRYQQCEKAHLQSKLSLRDIAQIYDPMGEIIYTNEENEIPTEKVVEPFGVVAITTALLGVLGTVGFLSGGLILILFGASLLSALISAVKILSNLDKYKSGPYLIFAIVIAVLAFWVILG